MRAITCCEPTGVVPVGKIINSIFRDPFFAELSNIAPSMVDEGTLAVDLSENGSEFIVRASLPGFTRDEIDVESHDGVLTIKAQKSAESEQKDEKFYRRERRFESQMRRVALPGAALEDRVSGELKDGVLTIRIPKARPSESRKVKIN